MWEKDNGTKEFNLNPMGPSLTGIQRSRAEDFSHARKLSATIFSVQTQEDTQPQEGISWSNSFSEYLLMPSSGGTVMSKIQFLLLRYFV